MTHYIPILVVSLIIFAVIDRTMCQPCPGPGNLPSHLAALALTKTGAIALGVWVLQPNVRVSDPVTAVLMVITLDVLAHTKPWLPLVLSAKRVWRHRHAHARD